MDTFSEKMQRSIKESNKYNEHPEIAKLPLRNDAFFIYTNRGLLKYDVDFFEFMRNGNIHGHVADTKKFTHQTVHLPNGNTLEAEIPICGTGWKQTPQISFVTEREPGPSGHLPLTAQPYVAEADFAIFEACPKLQDQPLSLEMKAMTHDAEEITPEPYCLYRFMVPPAPIDSRIVTFAGAYRSPATTLIAQKQALWFTAFFDNNVHELGSGFNANFDRILYETVLHMRFGKWRYSKGFGVQFPSCGLIVYHTLIFCWRILAYRNSGIRTGRLGGLHLVCRRNVLALCMTIWS